MHDPRDVKVELSSAGQNASDNKAPPAPRNPAINRPWLSVMFACCGVYQRVYKTNGKSRYEGKCPKCRRAVRFEISPGGTDDRTFIVR